ncbi:hypothetical protein, partial [Ferrimicrobium acidiphilum]|uniref:hypothetical protein n=1 Tax=Ferrimicrobium acidiphilum TaxID=121039 RepID=UPI0034DD7730
MVNQPSKRLSPLHRQSTMQSKATSLNLYYFIAHRAKVQTNPQNLTISSQQSWGQKQHNPPHVEGG